MEPGSELETGGDGVIWVRVGLGLDELKARVCDGFI